MSAFADTEVTYQWNEAGVGANPPVLSVVTDQSTGTSFEDIQVVCTQDHHEWYPVQTFCASK